MLSVEEITSHPGEQVLIERLDEGLRPLYRDDLPHHNYEHARDNVLPEVLRLDALQPVDPVHGRFNLIGATLGHDAGSHLPADPERPETKEERAARLIRPVLVESGFSARDISEMDGMVLATGIEAVCATPNQKKIRRGDIANVGGLRTPFLATTVNLFYEAAILAGEQGGEPPVWPAFIAAQQKILMSLLSQDLSLGDERISKGVGPFNRAAMKNVSWLSKGVVLDPAKFHSKYDQYMRPLVDEAALASIA
jgi:hypothetical protein